MEKRASDWRTILLVVGAAGGAVGAIGAAALVALLGLSGNAGTQLARTGNTSELDIAVLASALVVIGAVFVLAAYFGVQQLRGRDTPPTRLKTLRIWQGILLVLLWLGAAAGAGLLSDKPIIQWFTPVLYILAIAVPVYFFVRLATGGLPVGSRARVWGTLAAGIELGVMPALILELMVGLIGVVVFAVYMAMHPEQVTALQELARKLETTTNLEQIMNVVGPWLTSPLALLLALLLFAGASPVIEESAKSLATWTLYHRLSSPGQGFAIGAMSGAAFGLVESLLVSATVDANWTTTLLVRGASTMMHIMAASLTGWAIGQFRATHRVGRLLALYLAAMSLHGLWNASVVAIAFGGLRSAMASGRPDILTILLILAGGATLIVLFVSIPVTMGLINWRLRREGAKDATPPSMPIDTAPSTPARDVPWALGPSDDTEQQ